VAPSDDARWLLDLLTAAGQIALDHAASGMVIRRKADDTVVTDADVAAEAMIVAGLRARFPGEAIHGEEAGGSRGPIGWAVDPIDGTSAYTEGLAHWGPTVARFTAAPFVVLLGGLVLPRTGERFVVEGGVAWADGLRLGPITDETSQDVCYVPSRFHRRGRLDFAGKTRCLGGTAAHLALVARGSARAAIVAPGWSIWDTAAGLALIEAVGGVALRLPDGALLDPLADEGAPFVAGTIETARRLAQPGRLTVHPPREHPA
jgi:fructose-1,6-bisphosphatase/inositol monophosphatase family enzyme